MFGAKNVESPIFICKHLGTLLSPERFTAQISNYVERFAGRALLQSSRTWSLNWRKLTLYRAETNLRQPPKSHDRHCGQNQYSQCIWPMFVNAHSNISQIIKVRFVPLQKSTIINVLWLKKVFFSNVSTMGFSFFQPKCLNYTTLVFT